MPYIPDEQRPLFDPAINKLLHEITRFPVDERGGKLNYIVTRLLLGIVPEPRYSHFERFVGSLVCCLLEFYRRHVAPYEDKAIQRNGDVNATN
jgi:hypothetical protein